MKNLTHFYHGSTVAPEEVLHKGGLKPRGDRDGNWKHTIASRNDAVYLTDVYAGYFAVAAAALQNDARKAYVYEIAVERLDPTRLIPDEDFLEQATRGQSGKYLASPKASIADRTKFYRDRSHGVPHLWKESMEHLGTAAHLGPISAVMISRYAELDLEHLQWLSFALGDPTITLSNHAYCSGKYRTITSWLFEREVKAQEWMGLPAGMEDMGLIKDQVEKLQEKLANREGITVFSGPAHSTLYSFTSYSPQ